MPFLKKKQDSSNVGLMVKTRAPDEKPQEQQEENDDSAAVESAAQELIRAIHSKDIKAVAAALKDAFEILDAQPHVEGEHIEPHSYDSQNIKAAQD